MHHVPHFPVFKDSSTISTRTVKISTNALCLNDCLHTGPNMMPQQETMLLNSQKTQSSIHRRLIEKAFVQIELNNEDRYATRLLWLKMLTNLYHCDPENLVTYRFYPVMFGAAKSPYFLNATIQHHLAKQKH